MKPIRFFCRARTKQVGEHTLPDIGMSPDQLPGRVRLASFADGSILWMCCCEWPSTSQRVAACVASVASLKSIGVAFDRAALPKTSVTVAGASKTVEAVAEKVRFASESIEPVGKVATEVKVI